MNILKSLLINIFLLNLINTCFATFFNYHENYCYVNRWAFESICHHIFDPHTWHYPSHVGRRVNINFNLVKPGDTVFARDIKLFFQKALQALKVPIILVTAGDYLETFSESYIKNYIQNPNIIAWFAVHANCSAHPKLFAIPLGIDQRNPRLFLDWKNINNIFNNVKNNKKDKLLYVNYNNVNMKIRAELKEIWRNNPECFFSEPNKGHTDFFREMSTCKFTLCPPGWGPDSYRVWEALAVDSVPLIEKTKESLNNLYSDLPILIVDDLKKVTAEFLKEEYKKIIKKNNYNMQKLYMRYWIETIYELRKNFLISNGYELED